MKEYTIPLKGDSTMHEKRPVNAAERLLRTANAKRVVDRFLASDARVSARNSFELASVVRRRFDTDDAEKRPKAEMARLRTILQEEESRRKRKKLFIHEPNGVGGEKFYETKLGRRKRLDEERLKREGVPKGKSDKPKFLNRFTSKKVAA